MGELKMDIKELVIEALRTVYDPEISINIYDLGLIYDISIKDNICRIEHTLTSMMCPFADEICRGIEDAVNSVEGIEEVDRELVFDPPFSIELVSEEIRMAMGWY